MKKFFSQILVGLSAVVLIGLAVPAISQSSTGDDVQSYAVGSGMKLGRGIVNAATGWAEFFRSIYDKSIEHDPVTGLLYGSLHGVGMVVVRTTSGVYEAATFLFPTPREFKSTIKPEYVWQDWKR